MESVPASATKTFQKDSTVQAYNKAGSVIQHFTIPASLKHFEADDRGRPPASSGRLHGHQRVTISSKVLNGNATAGHRVHLPEDPGLLRLPQGCRQPEVQRLQGQGTVGQGRRHQPSGPDDKLTFSYNADGGAKPSLRCYREPAQEQRWASTRPPTRIPTFKDFRTPCPTAR